MSIVAKITEEEIFVQIKIKEAIFIEDNPETAFFKLKHFNELLDVERLAYTEHLANLFEMIGEEAFKNISSILKQFLNDSITIQIAMLKQMHQIIEIIKKRVTGYQEIKYNIMIFLINYLTHDNIEIQKLASKEIIFICPFLAENDMAELILAKLIDMAHDEKHLQNKIIAAEMLGQLTPIFGQKLCETYVCMELISLGIDLSEEVRVKSIQQLPKLAVSVNQKIIETKLIPFLKERCAETNQNIRIACVDSIPGISKYSAHEIKILILIPLFHQFLLDNKREIRKIAYQNLGLFISSIKFSENDEGALDFLLSYYLSMSDKVVVMLADGSEMLVNCAYYFPAVLQTTGVKKWPQLWELYKFLLSQSDEKIKKPLTYSFHEVAKILGPNLAESYLIEPLHQILLENNQTLRHGIIQNLAKFISVFGQQEREYMIDLLLTVQKDRNKWRSRMVIATSIFPLTQCFLPETVFYVIAPILFKMCSDPVAEVRKIAAKNVKHLLIPFLEGSEERNSLEDHIKAFSISKRFNQRQSYAWMCYKMFDETYFQSKFLENFGQLCIDQVQSVRITAMIVLDKYFMKYGQNNNTKEKKFLRQLMMLFTEDQSNEIKRIISKYTFVVNKKRKQSLKSNHSNHSKSSSREENKKLLDEIKDFEPDLTKPRRNSHK